MTEESLLYIVLIGIIALAIALFQYVYKKQINKENTVLLIFRFCSLFLIFLLFVNPSIEREVVQINKPRLFVAVDQSKSIEMGGNVSEIKEILDKIRGDDRLNATFDISYFGFGNKVQVLNPDSLLYNSTGTNLQEPLRAFSALGETQKTPVLFISDGNQNLGMDLAYASYKDPVFAYIVGDTTVYDDIEITRIHINKTVYVKHKFTVELFVNYQGSNTVNKKLSIRNGNREIASRILPFSPEKSLQIVTFEIDADALGVQQFSASVAALTAERNTLNNTRAFSIEVIDKKLKILLLYSILHPDIGMLKKAVKHSDNSLLEIQSISDFNGTIDEHQLLVLYQPTSDFERVFKEVIQKQQHCLIVTGRKTDWDFLNNNQNYFTKRVLNEQQYYEPVFNSDFSGFIIEDIGFDKFPPVSDSFGKIVLNGNFEILLQQRIGNVISDPMLVTLTEDNWKMGVLFGEQSWKWRVQSYLNTGSFEAFDTFVSNLILYLASSANKDRLNINLKKTYYSNEVVRISAKLVDDNLNTDSSKSLLLHLENTTTGATMDLPFSIENESYIIRQSNLEPGAYRYSVKITGETTVKSGVFSIRPFEIEQQHTRAEISGLQLVSTRTGGKLFYKNEGDKLLELLNSDAQFKPVQKASVEKDPLVDWEWLLSIIILFLAAEWIYRKYHGKI